MGNIKQKIKYVTLAITMLWLLFIFTEQNKNDKNIEKTYAKTTENFNLPNTTIAAPKSVFIEELTSPEIAELIKNGYQIAIIPTGGSEQNLAHMIIGKHNKIIAYTAEKIALELGNALVAPVIAYVPEGNINPPEGHMKYAGTISLREEIFSAVLEDTAASLKQHGFKLICFIGDSGGNQATQTKLAEKLSKEWAADGARVVQISDYYANNGQDAWVNSLKLPIKDLASHAGFEDTAELMVVDADGMRENLRDGDAKLATAQYGKKLLDLKIKSAVSEIKNASKP